MFKIQKYLGGRGAYPDPVLIPVAAGSAFVPGQAIKISGGVGVICEGEDAAQYVSTAKLTAEDSTAGKQLLCYKVDENMVFEAPLSAHASTVVVGAALTFAAGVSVTATTASKGGAKIIDVNGAAAAGDLVLCTLA